MKLTKQESKKMLGWAITKNEAALQCIEIQTPVPSGTDVLLEVMHCGVCHSDLHIWEGGYDLGDGERLSLTDRGVKLPLIPGHEIVGRVSRLGPDAEGVEVGDVRVVYPWIGCGSCAVCQTEDDNLCLNGRSIGIYQNGGYASHVLVPHPRYLVDPGNVDPAIAATYSCSGITVLSAIKKIMPLPPDEPVVLVGAGGLGLSAISILRAMRHEAIVIVDISGPKRSTALQAGARDAVDAGDTDVVAKIIKACGHRPWAIIDLVNSNATAAFSLAALRKGGTLVQVGLFGGEMRLQLPIMATQALTVRGSYVGSVKDLRELIALAQNGGVVPLPVEQLLLSHANEALNRLKCGQVTGRIVLRCE